MATIDPKRKIIHGKIVYYGPGLCGKTTNLEQINKSVPNSEELMSLSTEGDRTIFFDFLPMDLGKIRGISTKFKLYTVPGQVRYNLTRKMVLKNVDGVVFVADSQRQMLDANIESLENLFTNLGEIGIDPKELPIVLQYNKRDLKKNLLSREELDAALNKNHYKVLLASAMTGEGVLETLREICAITFKKFSAAFGDSEASPDLRGAAAPPKPVGPAAPPPPPPEAVFKSQPRSEAKAVEAQVRGATADAGPIEPLPGTAIEAPAPPMAKAKDDKPAKFKRSSKSAPPAAPVSAERPAFASEELLAQMRDLFDRSETKLAAELSSLLKKPNDASQDHPGDWGKALEELKKGLVTKSDLAALQREIVDSGWGASPSSGGQTLSAENLRQALATAIQELKRELPGKQELETLRQDLNKLAAKEPTASASPVSGTALGNPAADKRLEAIEGRLSGLERSVVGAFERLTRELGQRLASLEAGVSKIRVAEPTATQSAASPAQEPHAPAPDIAVPDPPPPIVEQAAPEEPPQPPVVEQAAPEEPPSVQVAAPAAEEDPRTRNAKRVARVMVSDLKLYYSKDVDEGLRQGDLEQRLKQQFEEMRKTYDMRIPEEVRASKDFLREALDDFLANKRKELGLS